MTARTVLTACLCAGVLLATWERGDARSLLTATEQACHDEGLHVLYRAQERDYGWSVTQSLQHTRTIEATWRTPAPTAVSAHREWLTKWVYLHWQVTGSHLRQITENACLVHAEQPAPMTKPTVKTLDRY